MKEKMKNGLDCTRQNLQFLWCLANSDTYLLLPQVATSCPRVPEGELWLRHNKCSAASRRKSEICMDSKSSFSPQVNNWALQIDLILWFHWDYRSSTGVLPEGTIFLGQTWGSINLITALFVFKQSIFGTFYWFFIQDTFQLLMIQLFLTINFWNCPHHLESYFSNPLNIENVLFKYIYCTYRAIVVVFWEQCVISHLQLVVSNAHSFIIGFQGYW